MVKHILTIYICFGLIVNLSSQGLISNYGQNRLQENFKKHASILGNKIEVIYPDSLLELAQLTHRISIKALSDIESKMNYRLSSNIKIIVFPSLFHFQKSYVSLEDPENNAKMIYKLPSDNMGVYFSNNYTFYSQQIVRNISELFMNEMLYGVNIYDKLQRLKSNNIPIWFTKGFPLFMAYNWDAKRESDLRELLRTNRLKNINLLSEDEMALMGMSLWRYLTLKYGTTSIGTLMFLTRYNSKLDEAIKYVTQKTMFTVLNEWRAWINKEANDDLTKVIPKGKINLNSKIDKKPHASFALNPDGKSAAICTNLKGKYTIWLFNFENQTSKLLLSDGLSVNNQLINNELPEIKWKDEKNLAILTETYNAFTIKILNVVSKNLILHSSHPFLSVSDFLFINNDLFLIISNAKHNNVVLYNTNYKTLYKDSNYIHSLFTFKEQVHFLTSKNDTNILGKTTINGKIDLKPIPINGNISCPVVYTDTILSVLSDATGMQNTYLIEPTKSKLISNYKTNILDQQLQNGLLAEMILFNSKYAIYTLDNFVTGIEKETAIDLEFASCGWLKSEKILNTLQKNLTSGYVQMYKVASDTQLIDTFKSAFYLHGFPKSKSINFNQNLKANTFDKPFILPFRNILKYQYFNVGIDNSSFGNYLFHFPQYVPNLMAVNYLGLYVSTRITDILKILTFDLKLRSNILFTNTDAFVKVSINKYRFQHSISSYRRSRKYQFYENVLTQNLTNDVKYIFGKPWDPRFRTEIDLGFRYEEVLHKLSEQKTKSFIQVKQYLPRYSANIIWDNTVKKYTHLNKGIKVNASIQGMFNKSVNMHYLTANAIHYIWISPKIQFAQRFSAAYKIAGSKQILHYVGGIENELFAKKYTTPEIENTTNFIFQSLTGTMRGFNPGIRLGTNFFVLNNEFRIPIHFLLNKNLTNNEIFKSILFIPFVDIATAFNGNNPYTSNNPYNTYIINKPNYILKVTNSKNPYIYSGGIGLAAKVYEYGLRVDYGIGFEENIFKPAILYLSLNNTF